MCVGRKIPRDAKWQNKGKEAVLVGQSMLPTSCLKKRKERKGKPKGGEEDTVLE
ncbi:hypothetical protein WH47_05865 [Habropoda laboriosa]|uniref:Uncharacterized protein n=1 Tax=Habropoda laboriosa TaxID=597456 RepID=A0A0L7QU45_9HYME|nr:hypothetical protein WH47_05865 [Habropoda laboriosa]